MLGNKIPRWFREVGILIFAASLSMAVNPCRALAAEKITFKYGIASQSVSYEELETFATTGEISPALNTLFKYGKQNPKTIRWILTQQFPADAKIIHDLLNTAPGEYVLTQTSNVVNTRAERANVRALRGSLIVSASDDNRVSLLELLKNYPTQQVYVNGKLLIKARRNFSHFVDQAGRYIKIPLKLLDNL